MFSSAPRCQRIRWRQSARNVGMTSVTTRHCMGEIIFAPSDFRASVISLSSVIANVSYTRPGSPGMSVPRESATAFSA